MKLIPQFALLFVLLPVIITTDNLKPLKNTTSVEKWYDKLPYCPCSYEEVKKLGETANPKGKWLDCGEANQDYHYGATYEVRWAPEDNDEPGQQCTYDRYTW